MLGIRIMALVPVFDLSGWRGEMTIASYTKSKDLNFQ